MGKPREIWNNLHPAMGIYLLGARDAAITGNSEADVRRLLLEISPSLGPDLDRILAVQGDVERLPEDLELDHALALNEELNVIYGQVGEAQTPSPLGETPPSANESFSDQLRREIGTKRVGMTRTVETL